jgi:hypothetical protein
MHGRLSGRVDTTVADHPAGVGPTRVGCHFLIVIAKAGAGGFYRSTGLPAGTVVIICIIVFGSRAANVAVCDISRPLFDGLTGVSRVGGRRAVPFRASTFRLRLKARAWGGSAPTTGDRFRQYRRRIGGADTGTEGVG